MSKELDDNGYLLTLRDLMVGPVWSKYPRRESHPLTQANMANMCGIYTELFPVDPFQDALASERRNLLKEVLSTLRLREKTIIILRFGLVDGEEHTLDEIRVMFGVTRERIRQIEQRALAKMRCPLRSRKLREIL